MYLIIFAIFICDATFTLFYRVYKRKKWYAAHREHAYQHLISYGASHKKVTVSILMVNIALIFPLAFFVLKWRGYGFISLMTLTSSLFITWLTIKLFGNLKS